MGQTDDGRTHAQVARPLHRPCSAYSAYSMRVVSNKSNVHYRPRPLIYTLCLLLNVNFSNAKLSKSTVCRSVPAMCLLLALPSLPAPAWCAEQGLRNGRASVRPSHRSTAAAACGEFAASLLSALWTGDIDRQQAPAISSSQQRCRDAAFGSNVSSVTLTADVGGWTDLFNRQIHKSAVICLSISNTAKS